MTTLVALPKYEKQVKRLLSNDERNAMEYDIGADPLAYPIIPRTGGFRKARWSRGSSGKRGGVRAIFYYVISRDTIFLTLLYAKNELENVTDAQEKQLKNFAKAIEKGQ